MPILFDNSTPRGLAPFLTGHSLEEARSRGWDELSNGELIDAAERAGFNAPQLQLFGQEPRPFCPHGSTSSIRPLGVTSLSSA